MPEFDLREHRVSNSSPESRVPHIEIPELPKRDKLDSEEAMELHAKLISYYRKEINQQAENRAEMAEDEDYYDNEQWSTEDKRLLRERGQAALVYNVISSTVNWVIGTEKRGRTDYKILPRRKEDGKPAERKSQLMKYLSDVNRSQFHKSRAFEDAVKVGIGWIECGVKADDENEPVYERYESWRNIYVDSTCTELDLSDARYLIRTKRVDLDIAMQMFPKRGGILKESAGDNYSGYEEHEQHNELEELPDNEWNRQQVRLIEIWYRNPAEVQKLRGGMLSGEIYSANNTEHKGAIENGDAKVAKSTMLRMHVAIITSKGMLWSSVSPYKHNEFPITPVWAYRRGRNGQPYGMIRGMKDIQDDINKRASKALHILSSNKVIMSEGAVPDMDAFLEEVSRPDGVLVVKDNKRLELNVDRDLAPAHLELMSRSIAMIQQQSGVTDELLGRKTNATSGIAIERRQDQGSMATAKLFDNLRFASQLHGEKLLSLIEQYFTEEKEFRITNMRGIPEYIVINDGLPDNDIVRTKADFIISEEDWRSTIRQSQVEELMNMLAKLAPAAPQLVTVMIDLIVESMDIPNREELVKRIRQVTNQRDPDAEELSPEEQQQIQAEQQQQEMQQRMMMAELQSKEAKAAKDMADAGRISTQAQKLLAELAGVNVETQQAALQTALAILTVPQAVPVADKVLKESEFVSRGEREFQEKQAMEQQQAMVQQQQLSQQQMPPQEGV